MKRYAYSPWENQTNNKPVKIPWRKISLQVLFPQALRSFLFHSLDDHLTFFSLISFLHLLFFPPCLFFLLFHFHSLSLFSGSKWKEGHLNIISLWTYRHISHCNRHHKKPSTSANPQDWLLALVPSRQVLEFSKEHCPVEDADNLSSRALTSIHVALRQYRVCQSRMPFWKGQKSSLDFLSWLLSGLFLSLLGNWTKLQESNFHFDRRNTILA